MLVLPTADPRPRTCRRILFGLVGTLALAGCSERGVVDPPDELGEAVVATLDVFDNPKIVTVLGDRTGLHAVARDSSGAVLCAQPFPGCAPLLLTEPFHWSMDVSGVVSMAPRSWGSHDNGGVHLTALTEGRVEVTASVQGVEGSAVVEVIERARLEWSVPLPGPFGGLSVGEDGTIYVAAGSGLQAMGAQGEVLWTYSAEDFVSAPAIAEDGTMYLASRDRLVAVDDDGNELWATPVEDVSQNAPPAIGPDGTVYLVSRASSLYAVSRSGQIEWAFEAPGFNAGLQLNRSPPAIAEDGTIYFGSEDRHLYAVDPDGAELWRFQTEGPVQSPSIGTDGTVYVANDWIVDAGVEFTIFAEGELFALSPEGAELWSAVLEEGVQSAPAIGLDGTVYLGSNNWIYAFDPAGSELWRQHWGPHHTPIVAGDGTIYGHAGGISALQPDATLKWRYEQGGGIRAPTIGFDGTIYAPRSDGSEHRLNAFTELEGSNGGYESAPWPQERGDRANTGRARVGG